MSAMMYELSVATFTRMLTNLGGLLQKAEQYAEQRKIDGRVLAEARLYPDMFPLVRQVQIAGDFAKGCSARLAGLEVPKYEDNETTLADLRARIARTLDFVKSVRPEQLAGSEERTIVHPLRTFTVTMKGLAYLARFALPNFYFHVSTAYDILRHNGLEIGKRDFVGSLD
jgi:uncharacterized protein